MELTLPPDWTYCKIDKIATINPRRPTSIASLSAKHAVTFVPMAAVNAVTGRIEQPEERLLSEVVKGFTYFEENDVLFAKITPCMQNGKSVIARNLCNGLGFGTTEFHVIRGDPNKVLPEWIWYFVRQQSFREEAVKHFRGSAGQQRVPADFLENYLIPIPSVDEQKRIISRVEDCMKRVNEIRTLQDESLKEACNLFEAFVEAKIESEWSLRPILEVSTEVRNGWSWKESSTGQPTQVLRLSAVRNLSLDLDEVRTVCLESKHAGEFSLKKDDVFIVRGNGSKHLVGRSAISTDDHPNIVFNDLLIRLRFTPEMLPEFANFMLHSRKVREQIEHTAKTAAGIWKINQTGIRSLKLPCPPISVQKEKLAALQEGLAASRQIVQHFSQTDTKALSAAILRKAFAGEL